jgi:hypothetical protein
MANWSEGARNLCTYATFALLAFAGGGILTAQTDLNDQKAAAVAMIGELSSTVQDVRLQLAELNLTDQLNQAATFPPEIPPAQPAQGPDIQAVQDRLALATGALKRARDHFADGQYWRVDNDVRSGLNAVHEGAGDAVPDIERIDLERILGILMPPEAKMLGLLAGATSLLSLAASLDTDRVIEKTVRGFGRGAKGPKA